MSFPPTPAQEPTEPVATNPPAPSLAASLTNATQSGDPSLQQLAMHRMQTISPPDGVPTLEGTPSWWQRLLGRDNAGLRIPTQQRPPARAVLFALLGGAIIVVGAFYLTFTHLQGNTHAGNNAPTNLAGAASATNTPLAAAAATSAPPTQTPTAATGTAPSPTQPPTDVPGQSPPPTPKATAIPPTATPNTCTVWENGPNSNANTVDSKNANYNESIVLQGLYNSATGTFCGQFRTAAVWWIPTSTFSQGTLTMQTLTYHGSAQIATNQATNAVPFNEPANYYSDWRYGDAVSGTCARGISTVVAPAHPAVVAPAPWSNTYQDANGNDIWCP